MIISLKNNKFKIFLFILLFIIIFVIAILVGNDSKVNKISKYQTPIEVASSSNPISYVQILTLIPDQQSSTSISSSSSSYPSNVSLLMIGDVMLARNIGTMIENGSDPFVNVKQFFSTQDLVIANLETNISTPGISSVAKNKLYTFNAPLKSLQTIKNSGIGIVSLANNHTMDYGSTGLLDMINHLNQNSIPYFGAGSNNTESFSPHYLTVKGVRIGFVGVNDIENYYTVSGNTSPGSAFLNSGLIKTEIQTAKSNSDLVIVFPHWGNEYNLNYNGRQQQYAHEFIDEGADIVVGSHPHVIEPSEIYKGKYIYYSMGNFIFDGMYGIPNASKGEMVEINISNKKITNTHSIPVNLSAYGIPSIQ